mmetsp:Transcript_18520/g.27459  ORF Transcript_18520/g.27459 Transcript_18520/m.27459 type:complete len:378 (+) Transcript_18520:49-1182(+)|eukprot:CAMPEP_0194259320 /NCGR_PEP_ID=MMETSP0158-20130606/43339_1 /TAXON_ID=33649 /ORGANISM="Thalassionema nitzschioides, Strain L26-B" /LENGTH=377 /DNA_ID=CAMNT_0038999083 /DNA_START=41 /DNA_END=1174 /DNA_ORIENTATION=-
METVIRTSDHNTNEKDLLPFNTLQESSNSRVASLCFLPKGGDVDSSDDDEPFILRSQQLLPAESTAQQNLSHQYLLASCHINGEAHVWDLSNNRIKTSFGRNDGESSGLAVKLVDGDKLAYQTRDGTVSIHDLNSMKQLCSWEQNSRSFCSLAVCRNKDCLLALPSKEKEVCTIRDLRCADSVQFRAGDERNHHGMLMSIAMCDPIVALGMEDGNIFFHDWRMPTSVLTNIKLSQYFILGLDLAPSLAGSMVAIAGMAGNSEDLNDLPSSEQGTVAVVKCTVDSGKLHATLRARVGTCSLSSGGNPGVDVARFRPDGRIFSIGGWDKRIRLFDRRNASSLGTLKGHTKSVTALDWANNSILASGDDHGMIYIWNAQI